MVQPTVVGLTREEDSIWTCSVDNLGGTKASHVQGDSSEYSMTLLRTIWQLSNRTKMLVVMVARTFQVIVANIQMTHLRTYWQLSNRKRMMVVMVANIQMTALRTISLARSLVPR